MKKITFLLLFLPLMAISQIPSYYNDVNLSLTGTALKDELATKIINTHTRFLSYSQVWDASKITDLDPIDATQSKVILVYGYNDNDGNYVTDRTRSKDLNGGTAGTDWNREHTYPKSLGNPNLGTTGPGSDAHHLRPSDVTFNGQRSSKKFASGSGNAGDSNGGWYPGDEWKGDIARMMMYMYLRYGSQCLPTNVGIGSSSNTPDAMIDLFLQWNAEDPVSQIEINRNEYHGLSANAFAQGNRNPFIDNPALATEIWGGPQAEDRFGNTNPGDTQAPTAPTNLIASNTTETGTSLAWSPATDNVAVTGYDIYRNGVLAYSTVSTTLSIDDLVASTAYAFEVYAKDTAGNMSISSNSVSITTLAGSGTGTANELFFSEYVEGSSNNKALEIANFTGAIVNLAEYSLKRNTNGGSTWGAAFSLSGTVANGNVIVIANSSSNATILSVANITTSSDALLFNGNDPVGLFKNNVLIDVIGNFAGGSANFAKDITLRRKESVNEPNVNYLTSEWDIFSIDTFNGLGNHTISGGGNNPDTEAPTAPSNLAASNIGETSLTLAWNPSTDNTAVTAYDVFINGDFLASTNETTYNVIGLTAATNYSFVVYAKDVAGNISMASSALNTSTIDTTAPTTPTNLTATNTTQTTTDLSWTPSSDNVAVVSYNVFQDGTIIGTTSSTNFNVSGLVAATTYDFNIVAIDAASNTSSSSNTVQITTQSVSTTEVLFDNSFETGWEGWSDGGSDCYRINSSRSYDGSYSIRIRDNSGIASSMTSSAYNVSSYTNLEVTFFFYSYSMENGEDFWLQYFDGTTWRTFESYISGIDFENNSFYTATATISNNNYSFPTDAQFRFRCDASSNADQIYIDKVSVVASSGTNAKGSKNNSIDRLSYLNTDEFEVELDDLSFYPNPAKNFTTIRTEIDLEDSAADVQIKVISLQGKVVKTLHFENVENEFLENRLDLSNLEKGMYLIQITTSKGFKETKKVVIQ